MVSQGGRVGIVVGVDVLLKRVKTWVGGGGRGVDVVLAS